MLADGGECVADLGGVRDQEALFGPVASDLTAFRVIDRVAADPTSNNSSSAVAAYLNAHKIHLDLIAGRTSPDPTLLKPSPYLINETIHALANEPDAYILVGDSVNDIVAARRAAIRSIGYANAHGKHRALSDAGADVIIDDMATLCRAADASA